jgi:hypothetical protein
MLGGAACAVSVGVPWLDLTSFEQYRALADYQAGRMSTIPATVLHR